MEAKLEMVRAAGLFHYGAAVSRVRWIDTCDRLQRDEIDGRLQGCIAHAKTDPAVIEALGSPIKNGFLVSGKTNVNGASGESNLAIPISGPVVEVGQTHERIDVLQKSAPINSP